MKPLKLYNFPLTLAVLAAVFLFQGCLRDRCDMSYTYAKYSPVYMSQAEFENAVSVQPARAIVNPGKIFVKDAFLFVNETGKGVHIFDNKNPAQPQALAFLSVPGTYELAFNCDNLILDSSTDLLVFDMSNPQSPELVSRTRNSLPGLSEYKGFVADPSKGVVVEWIREIVTEKYDCEAG
ncbi:MAG: hypothetical protein EAZ89_11685, partial [Bacteroidetes bacterium]